MERYIFMWFLWSQLNIYVKHKKKPNKYYICAKRFLYIDVTGFMAKPRLIFGMPFGFSKLANTPTPRPLIYFWRCALSEADQSGEMSHGSRPVRVRIKNRNVWLCIGVALCGRRLSEWIVCENICCLWPWTAASAWFVVNIDNMRNNALINYILILEMSNITIRFFGSSLLKLLLIRF